MGTSGRARYALLGTVAAGLMVALVACTAAQSGADGSVVTKTTIVGTSTVTSTLHTDLATFTLAPTPSTTASSTSKTRPTATSTHPSTSKLPAAEIGDCPYIDASDVMSINGQHNGPTSIIPTKPYPICTFTRADGGYLATTRIIKAASPAAAKAVVDSFAPVDQSFPVTYPVGWSGGAMALPNGNADNPDIRSVYAVSKGPIVIVAESNQQQSIKGRQMAELIVANMGW